LADVITRANLSDAFAVALQRLGLTVRQMKSSSAKAEG
jgi:hypothetical protein